MGISGSIVITPQAEYNDFNDNLKVPISDRLPRKNHSVDSSQESITVRLERELDSF